MRKDHRNTRATESNFGVFIARERTVSQKCQVEGECCHQHATLLSCAKRLCIKRTTSLSGDFECSVPFGTLLIIHEFALYHIPVIILSFILH